MPGLIPAHAGKTNARRGMKYRGAAHPRSRGENQSRVRRHTPPPGSSPLTRGKQSEGTGAFTHHGLIPAHAGKTLTDKHPVRTVTAHPRSRGENVMCFFAPSAVQGSSPLTRGKLSLLGVVLRSVGLIPAHAGKTLITSAANSTVRAHPRSRGENGDWETFVHRDAGSSPLTRGKLSGAAMDTQCTGLIPAHAGKTQVGGLEGLPVPGSSPLTRGKRRSGAGFPVPPGLIPAHAGKTRGTGASRRGAGAHPRSRGENILKPANAVHIPGSSPLTRGKRNRRNHRGESERAHPRSRGENPGTYAAVGAVPGSSPLTRGKHRIDPHLGPIPGLIPAHAGKTVVAFPPSSSCAAHPRSRGENTVSTRTSA